MGLTMTKANSNIVPYVNTWFWPSMGLVTSSSLFFSIYIGKVTNAHEWKDIMLDYCHHKRTYYSPHNLDKIARVVMNVLNGTQVRRPLIEACCDFGLRIALWS